ncbi:MULTISPECIES: tRNA-(ms[2]io[6]A)-hydroxylase [unclassified Agarivorans]|uniref:tRNA-(ms[2]io[6]A)-hydroxylase n=1 Tax=unclassified Agarivorans TaxID=2636026 RepID=UPI0026E266C6|nr:MULTISPECIES: tRNA isopentenyl-2-thiomethyl-A-37 hydroxylase MiaE [unclassified Agarivorans]MDO6684955.1 tRNA isopentenyl-2-thiomethyl-A-37 hydroxylase MiaE [Agarivorans sp. 3_MG-2023]MDO6714884.1 tRNA isopentenyl-2-thiomethyl-A-37 hydroxylase MiaE [Agarivorans sp. 2_MG-2023]
MPYSSLLAPINQFLFCSTPQAWIEQARKPENLSLLLADHANAEWKAAATASKLISKYVTNSAPELQQELKNLLAPYEYLIFRAGKWSVEGFKQWFFPQGIRQASKEQQDLAHATLNIMTRCYILPLLVEQLSQELNLNNRSMANQYSALNRDSQREVNAGLSAFQAQLIDKMRLLIREELHHFEQVCAIMNSHQVSYKNISAGGYAKALIRQVRHFEPQALADKLIVGAYIEARSCERFALLAPHLPQDIGKFYQSLLRSEARHYQDYLSLAASILPQEQLEPRIQQIGQAEAEFIQQTDPTFRFHSGIPIS